MSITMLPSVKKKLYHIEKNYINDPLCYGDCRILQIGRLFCSSATEIPIHAHTNFFELTIVTDGKGIVHTNGEEVEVVRGDIFVSFPCDFHGIISDADEPLKYDFFAFTTTDEELTDDLEEIMSCFMLPSARIIRDEVISSLINGAISETGEVGKYSKKLLTAVFSQVIIRLVRAFLDNNHKREGSPKHKDSLTLCYTLMNYIDTHVYTMTSLEELSEVTNYNYNYLSSLFKRETSGTLSDYYRNKRLESARLLVLENELSITEISEILNYSSIYTFSRAFKDKYGVSPEKYRCNAR